MTDFNTVPLTRLAAVLARVSGVKPPEKSDRATLPELESLIREKTSCDTVEKLLIYNPDAIGEKFYLAHKTDIFSDLDAVTDLRLDFLTAFPPKTPVCFATMFSGASPKVHGIRHYEKPVLTVDTLFDEWAKAGKKTALISKAGQSVPKIFADRPIDYFITDGDEKSVDTAVELIKNSDYDIIEVYNQEYDDMLHKTYPESYFCLRAARRYVASYKRLSEAVKSFWADYSALTTFAPDHGAHRIGRIFLGTHGDRIPDDMNISHFYTVYDGRKKS
jgi:hypothetical protein